MVSNIRFLWLCKTPNKIVVGYAFKNVNSPAGVAEYQLTEAIPENLKKNYLQ